MAPGLRKPGQTRKKLLSSEPSKFAIDGEDARDSGQAQQLINSAEELARAGRLTEAADTMEEAFNKSPEIRDKYAQRVSLWRRGMSM